MGNMRTYELVLVLKPSLTISARKKMIDTVIDWFQKLKIVKKEEVGDKPLSYKIKKQTSGFFVDMVVEGDVIPSDLEKRLLNNEDVLRHLLIRRK